MMSEYHQTRGGHSPVFTTAGKRLFSKSRKMVSIIVPAYNEELNLETFYTAVSRQLDELDYYWEILFVNDGSRDQSLEILHELNRRDSRVKAIHFSRNFGNQMAITAGLEHAIGDVVIVMDADLQQPPKMIPKLLDLWKQGFHVVNTIRNYGEEIGWFKKFSSSMFYRIMNLLSKVRIEPGVSDFRLMDRRVVNILNNMPEQSRFIRAQIAWLGFRQTTISYQCNKRNAGNPSFSTMKLLVLALDGIFSFSSKPLRWIAYLGCLLMAVFVPYGIWGLFQFFVFGAKTPGWTSLIMANIFLGGATLISLGLIGEYIARIYDEVKHRPRYIVQESDGLECDRYLRISPFTDQNYSDVEQESEQRNILPMESQRNIS